MFKAIIFDLDGVITDTARFHYEAWHQLAKEELDFQFDETFNENLKGVSRLASLEKILDAKGVLEKYSDEEKQNLANKKNIYYLSLIQALTSEDLLPGIEKLLIYLRANHIKIGLGSASKNGPFILEKLGVSEYFDVIVDPALVKGKPEPDIFLEGARLLAVSPEEVIGVEDAFAGIQAINRAKMVSIGVGDKVVLQEARYIVPTTRYLLELIATLIRTLGD